MTEPRTVNIADLRVALLSTLDVIEQQLGAEVSVDVDYYWHLPVVEAFDMTRELTLGSLTSGQVSDDIVDAIENKRERVSGEAWHDLSHLIGILRALELRCLP